MKQKYIISLLWSLSTLCAFFLGYMFSLREQELEIQKIRETPLYIDVTTSKKNISFALYYLVYYIYTLKSYTYIFREGGDIRL